MRGFAALRVFRLARQPTWLLGYVCMIAGFVGVGTGAMLLTSHATQPRRPEAGEATNRELTRRSR